MKHIGILTSSRADYGIYLPLLRRLRDSDRYAPQIIAFGTHLSAYHGRTVEQIAHDGFEVPHKVPSLLIDDSPEGIAGSMALTMMKFGEFWKANKSNFELVFALGDRFEMFGAVYASTVFRIPLAHVHGGETTLGAVDDIYRHAITHASELHFTSTKEYADKVIRMTGSSKVFNVGALGLDNLNAMQLLSLEEMRAQWDIDFSIRTILITVHPETRSYERNQAFAAAFTGALRHLATDYQLVVTLPNADTNGTLFRSALHTLRDDFPKRIKLVENFGTRAYFSAMKWSVLMVGNTSSGIIEAASFGKYAVNVGDRQGGRLTSGNVVNTDFDEKRIVGAVTETAALGEYQGANIYFKGGAAKGIVAALDGYLS